MASAALERKCDWVVPRNGISVAFPEDTIQDIHDFTRAMKTTRTEAIRILVEWGLEQAKQSNMIKESYH